MSSTGKAAAAGVKIIECPRDALQGCRRLIPAERKAEYLDALLAAGFRHLDCASFVSPRATPQMADSEEALRRLGPPPPGAELIGIVLNRRGAERALATAVTTLGFPYSLSPTFQRRNAGQSLAETRAALEECFALARGGGRSFVVYLSMAFGNPYGDAYSVAETVAAVGELAALGAREIALADTVGLAEAEAISSLFTAVAGAHPGLEIGLHLHSRRDSAAEKIRAAYAAGCRRFDCALGGLGGCPFAGDELVGNLPTEILLETLAELGAAVEGGPDLSGGGAAFGRCLEMSAALRREFCD